MVAKPRCRTAGVVLLMLAATPLALGWSGPGDPSSSASAGMTMGSRAAQPRLAQTYPQQQGPWNFRPRTPTNARGVPPTSGPTPDPTVDPYYGPSGQWRRSPPQYRAPANTSPARYPPARYGPYGQPLPSGAEPHLEVRLFDNKPYVQEPVLLQLDVVSSGNLATASPELSGFDSVLLEEIAGPKTSVRSSGRHREIINRYLLALTPLRPGEFEVGPFKVSGTLAGGVPFSAVAASKTGLEVQPIVPSVRPWLPLQALRLTRELEETASLEEGRPVTMTLRLEAIGGLGEQLPSLEPMLASSDFRSYRERTIIENRLSDDERQLQGIRTEIYTLVPYSGGRLQLPEVRVNWWNVEAARRESSSVPIRSLSVAGEAGPFGFGRSSPSADQAAGGWAWFWIPVGGLLLLLIGYWAGVWYRVKHPVRQRARREPLPPRLRRRARLALAGTVRGAGAALQRLNPVPPLSGCARGISARLRRWTPASMRIYRCAVDAERAGTPAEWALLFQANACQRLRSPSREPLPRVADRIVRMRPGADAARLRALIQELDVALYNGGELDFRRWKREFRRALRPGWGAFAGIIGSRFRRGRLPELNPSP